MNHSKMMQQWINEGGEVVMREEECKNQEGTSKEESQHGLEEVHQVWKRCAKFGRGCDHRILRS